MIAKQMHQTFWLWTLGVCIIVLLPFLIQDGMFIDGIQYAAISRNLANGLGSFWFPYLSEIWNKQGSQFFLEHPPLVYALQSLFFRFLGDSIYTERIYCLVTAIVSAWLMIKIWNAANTQNTEIKRFSWLPILYWMSMPVVFWSYQMNVMENTMGIFTLAAIWLVVEGLKAEKRAWILLVFSGMFVFIATLCKGAQGLFPLAAAPVFWWVWRKTTFLKMMFHTAIMVSIPALLYLLILQQDQAYTSLSFYFHSRLLERVANEPVVNHHFHSLFRLFGELLPVTVISIILILFARGKSLLPLPASDRRYVYFFILVGLTGSLPLCLTLVQRDFYLAPSLPYFALGAAAFSAHYLNQLKKKLSDNKQYLRFFRWTAYLLIGIGLMITSLNAGKAKRDMEVLHDVYILGDNIGEHKQIRFHASEGNHWNTELYLIRHFNISVGARTEEAEYMIRLAKDGPPEESYYKHLPLPTIKYNLYKNQTASHSSL